LVTALAVEQSEEWLTGRRYLDMEELREHRRLEDCEAEEAMLVERQNKSEASWRKLQKRQDLTRSSRGLSSAYLDFHAGETSQRMM
jgi:hypothetical protein